MNKWTAFVPVGLALLLISAPAFAEPEAGANYAGLGAGIAMGVAVLGGGIGQGLATRGMYESISRNPAAASKLNAPFYVGLAFIESLVIFTMLVAFNLAGKA